MANNFPEMHYFDLHCSTEIPFFCHFSSTGAAYHCHADFYELCLVVSGSYKNIYHGIESICEIGQLLLFAPGQSHELTTVTQNSHHYALIIRESYFREYCKKHLDNAEQVCSTPFLSKKLSGVQFAYISQLTSSITYSTSAKSIALVDHLLSNLLFACFESIPDTTANSTKIYAVDLLQRLNNYQILNIDVKEMYADYPISQSALINDFRNLTGYTIVQYRNLKRMEYAATLLAEANYSVTDISSILNISCPGYFSEQFKKVYGMSPKQYQLLKHASKKGL